MSNDNDDDKLDAFKPPTDQRSQGHVHSHNIRWNKRGIRVGWVLLWT